MRTALIVDDVISTRQCLGNLLVKAFPNISIQDSSTVSKAIEIINKSHLGIALIDLGLPDGNGCEVIKYLKNNSPDCFIVVVTIFDDEMHLFSALQAGADGYLLKDTSELMIVNKFQEILNGEPPLTPSISRKILRHFTHTRIPQNNSPEVKLSPREIDVLTLVAKGYSRKEIAKLLDLSPNTVSRYIKDAYKRLNISSKAEAAIEACRMGLVDSDNFH